MQNQLSNTTEVVVVSYNPEIKLLKNNLEAILGQFKNVLVVDNNSSNAEEIEQLIKKCNFHVELINLDDNEGIAAAQNIGLKKATDKKLEWILTMDQDSVIPDNLAIEYQKVIDSYDHIGLIGWNQRRLKTNKKIVANDWFILSSGCLMSVKALDEVGGFDEKLFIDHVDTDANIKIKNKGYLTLTTNTVKLVHNLGTKTGHKTLRGNPYITHSPVRIYYNVRNGVTLFKRYFFRQPHWTVRALINNLREGAYLLIYQPNKFKNFKLLLRAWFDGSFNRLGKFKG